MSITQESLPAECARAEIDSPVGALTLIASDAGLHAVLWRDERSARELARVRQRPHPVLAKATAQLREYFAGARRVFDLPLVIDGTPFQVRAWRELLRIPYGRTISYSEQARRLGDPNKARAVGTANARNRIAIVIPCHRVIAASGALAGFGGGLDNKRILLALEEESARGGELQGQAASAAAGA
ncbi:MAG TPA: methylated-DNA--[protein]-cysteine S-methyltransferase [Polyangiaceae bacterium]|nr:methylated-DNA--[protein]-cysteine S-methyltransferase [Polyangiaceae bacterium]